VNIFAKMDCNGWSAGVASMVRTVSGFIQKVWEVGPDILSDHFDLHSTDIVVKIFISVSRNVGRFCK
jgi:hypothetical protein